MRILYFSEAKILDSYSIQSFYFVASELISHEVFEKTPPK